MSDDGLSGAVVQRHGTVTVRFFRHGTVALFFRILLLASRNIVWVIRMPFSAGLLFAATSRPASQSA